MSALYIVAAGLPKVNFTQTLANGLKAVAVITALLSIIFVAYGGLKYVTSVGSPEGTKQAKETITYALIGLAVGVSATVIVSFVIGRLQ